jgi:uncharacterized delta-60 repeat protein
MTTIRRPLSLFALALLMCTARYAGAQAGSLDPSFGDNGIVNLTASMRTLNAVAIQSDGKIILGGSGLLNDGITDTLIRLNTNGSLDTSFGTGGIANLVPPTTGSAPLGFFAMAIQSNGEIVAAAATSTEQGGYAYFVQLARVRTNGNLDTSFGSGGFTATTAIGFTPDFLTVESLALALQSNGSILVASSYSNLMARFTNVGQLDTTFGSAGLVNLTNQGPNVSFAPSRIVVEASGKILVASGTVAPTPLVQAGIIGRYNSNGSLDTTFAAAGTTASVASGSALLLESDGKLAVAGSITSKVNAPPATNDVGFGVARYNLNGAPDMTFGTGGVAVADFGANLPLSGAFALAIQSNGELVAAGAAAQGPFNVGFDSAFGLARFTTSGALDTSFGTDGLVTTTLASGTTNVYSYVTGLAIQSDGKIVAAGSTLVGQGFESGTGGYVARYLGQ